MDLRLKAACDGGHRRARCQHADARLTGRLAERRAVALEGPREQQCATHEEGATVTLDGCEITVGGIAKGAGMLEPAMATMLAFVTTDAAIDHSALDAALRVAVDHSFNVMTVDGCVANIGSANLNMRSVSLDEEINVVVVDDDFAATLEKQFDEDLDRSVRIEPSRWERRSPVQRLAETVVRPIRRLF